jgi:adenine-specific DNA-methyltransferase
VTISKTEVLKVNTGPNLDDFKKEKIIWIELSDRGRFALSTEEIYLLNSAYFLLPPKSMSTKYLLGILNSKVIQYYLQQVAQTSGMGVTRWINNFVKDFPVPVEEGKISEQIEGKVENLLALHREKNNEIHNNEGIQSEIDQLIYEMYKLTPDEIKIIEDTINR